jgi:hypothetical protein
MIYISVSKAASTRIKAIMSEIAGRPSRVMNKNRGKFRSTADLRNTGFFAFHQMAVGGDTLRFSFVRNPYDRLVSCWANKFQKLPLVPGQSKKIDTYLGLRKEISPLLPVGPDQTMSFADFVVYATGTNTRRLDQHWNLQSDVLEMPGIRIDLLGKVENFALGITRMLDRLRVPAELKAKILNRVVQPLNPSARGSCAQYYTTELAETVYRAYQEDFDKLKYSRVPPE